MDAFRDVCTLMSALGVACLGFALWTAWGGRDQRTRRAKWRGRP